MTSSSRVRIFPYLALLLPLTAACLTDDHTVGEDDAGESDAASFHDGGVGKDDTGSGKHDAGGGKDDGGTGKEDAALPSCGADEACPSGSNCYYPIGSCSAKGQCMVWPTPGAAECNSFETLCGCDGTQVFTGCAEPDGYASGPTTGGQETCSDVACGADNSCPSGLTCFFPIGSCTAKGICQ
jgi:hypothetical protein